MRTNQKKKKTIRRRLTKKKQSMNSQLVKQWRFCLCEFGLRLSDDDFEHCITALCVVLLTILLLLDFFFFFFLFPSFFLLLSVSFKNKKKDRSIPEFTVIHYAGKVVYNANKFLQKNRDVTPLDVNTLLKECTLPLIASLLKAKLDKMGAVQEVGDGGSVRLARTNTARRKTQTKRQTVADCFRESLDTLMNQVAGSRSKLPCSHESSFQTQMSQCTPHFIRCIKPNRLKLPAR